jgi:MFS family permease
VSGADDQPVSEGAKFGPVRLAPGVQGSHLGSFLFAAFVSIGLFTYVTALQPYLLAVNLGIPTEQQGSVTGRLAFAAELVIAVCVGVFGALSDRIGRRPVYVAGFLVLALGYAAYPFADDPNQLLLYRVVFAVGVAALTAMLSTVLADYPREQSRGALTGIAYFLNGIGVVLFALLLTRMPSWFQAAGYDEVAAGRWSFLVVAAVSLLAAFVMLGLKSGTPSNVHSRASVVSLLRKGLAAGRNPRIALAYGTAFASRGDLAVVGTFLTLWAVQTATRSGLTPAEATVKAGVLFAIVQSSALVWAVVFGAIADRVNRVTLTALAMGLAAVGYLLIGLNEDPLSPAAMFEAVLLGIGQMSAILASQVLVGQEAPAEVRGSVLGVNGVFGAIGILFVSLVGGWLFDAWTPAAPFLLMAVANGVLCLWALLLRGRTPGTGQARLGAGA